MQVVDEALTAYSFWIALFCMLHGCIKFLCLALADKDKVIRRDLNVLLVQNLDVTPTKCNQSLRVLHVMNLLLIWRRKISINSVLHFKPLGFSQRMPIMLMKLYTKVKPNHKHLIFWNIILFLIFYFWDKIILSVESGLIRLQSSNLSLGQAAEFKFESNFELLPVVWRLASLS